MKIWGDVPKVSGVYGKHKGLDKVERTAPVKNKKDMISISTQGKDYQAAVKAVKETPDVRQEKINDLLKKYESGSYNVNGKEVADNIIKSIIDRKI